MQVRQLVHSWLKHSGHPRLGGLLAHWVSCICHLHAGELRDGVIPLALRDLYPRRLHPALQMLACEEPTLERLTALEAILTQLQQEQDEDVSACEAVHAQVQVASQHCCLSGGRSWSSG